MDHSTVPDNKVPRTVPRTVLDSTDHCFVAVAAAAVEVELFLLRDARVFVLPYYYHWFVTMMIRKRRDPVPKGKRQRHRTRM